jgi:hypothetical protein
MTAPDLPAFILARVEDWEKEARDVPIPGDDWCTECGGDSSGLALLPEEVLATCKAHRAIVELHGRPHECSTYDHTGEVDNCSWCLDGDECSTLRALAAVYADHEDYRAEWAL